MPASTIAAGGEVLLGPQDVAGGSWVAQPKLEAQKQHVRYQPDTRRGWSARRVKAALDGAAPQQCLNLRPLPQRQGSFRLTARTVMPGAIEGMPARRTRLPPPGSAAVLLRPCLEPGSAQGLAPCFRSMMPRPVTAANLPPRGSGGQGHAAGRLPSWDDVAFPIDYIELG